MQYRSRTDRNAREDAVTHLTTGVSLRSDPLDAWLRASLLQDYTDPPEQPLSPSLADAISALQDCGTSDTKIR